MPGKSRSVEKDIEGFCGWPFLEKLITASGVPAIGGLMAAMFGTGGRISEVLGLRKWNVDLTLHPDVVVVKQMPLSKRFRRVGTVTKYKCRGHCNKRWDQKPTSEEAEGHKVKRYKGWITEPIADHRTFPIRRDEPLTRHFITWANTVREANDLLFTFDRTRAFLKVREVGRQLDMDIPFCNIRSPQLYDHWFRAERACQLAFDYGFLKEDLEEFFEWKERKPSMAQRYSSLGWKGLARKMDVEV